MNTRLQVEHPVTEEVTGLDLVRAQLIVASGDPLPWLTPPTQRGHAIEARVYAEDPEHGFLPQAGRVLLYREPRAPGVRIDSGVAEGAEVPVHYDPLLAKVIASAETRELARARLAAALRDFPILGIRTNVPFLLRILDDARFRAGDVDTTFLDSSMDPEARRSRRRRRSIRRISSSPPWRPSTTRLTRAAQDVEPRRAWDPWQQLRDWRPRRWQAIARTRHAACARHVLRRRRRAAGNRLRGRTARRSLGILERPRLPFGSGGRTDAAARRVPARPGRRSRCRRRCRRR